MGNFFGYKFALFQLDTTQSGLGCQVVIQLERIAVFFMQNSNDVKVLFHRILLEGLSQVGNVSAQDSGADRHWLVPHVKTEGKIFVEVGTIDLVGGGYKSLCPVSEDLFVQLHFKVCQRADLWEQAKEGFVTHVK